MPTATLPHNARRSTPHASLLAGVEQLPPDPILGLAALIRRDPRPGVVNLASGVYQDEHGQTPTFAAVRAAERMRWDDDAPKSYLPIAGRPEFAAFIQSLLFGDDHAHRTDGRAVTAHCAGGTGALAIAAQLVRRLTPDATVWVSDPTWPNHPAIFTRAGLPVASYAYLNRSHVDADFAAVADSIRTMRPGDAVVLQVCCHNPTGIDPTREQWRDLLGAVATAGVLPVLDFAYQGFAESVACDAWPIRHALSLGLPFLVASSLSKNMGLYQERVGAITAVAPTARDAAAVLSQIESCIRATWSNPPAHGAEVALRVAATPHLHATWLDELDRCRVRIAKMRAAFAQTLAALDPARDHTRYARQRGMFSLLPLSPQQVLRLRDDHAIYLVATGRINFCGLNPANLTRTCAAIATVLRAGEPLSSLTP